MWMLETWYCWLFLNQLNIDMVLVENQYSLLILHVWLPDISEHGEVDCLKQK